MRDVVFVLITIGFFALAALFVGACARIIGPGDALTTADGDGDAVAAGSSVPLTR